MHHSASSYFLLFFYFWFPPYYKCSKNSEKSDKNQCTGSFQKHLGGARGDPPGPQAPSRRALGWGRARGPPGPLLAPLAAPLRKTPRRGTLFRGLSSVPPPSRFQDREHQNTSSRHPAGGRNHLRELLHHHGCFPDEP